MAILADAFFFCSGVLFSPLVGHSFFFCARQCPLSSLLMPRCQSGNPFHHPDREKVSAGDRSRLPPHRFVASVKHLEIVNGFQQGISCMRKCAAVFFAVLKHFSDLRRATKRSGNYHRVIIIKQSFFSRNIVLTFRLFCFEVKIEKYKHRFLDIWNLSLRKYQ